MKQTLLVFVAIGLLACVGAFSGCSGIRAGVSVGSADGGRVGWSASVDWSLPVIGGTASGNGVLSSGSSVAGKQDLGGLAK